MKAVLPHVRHVQKPVTPVQNIATVNRAWNNAKHYAGNVRMPAVNAQTSAGRVMLQHRPCSSVPMPAAVVQKNAKSTTMSIVRNAQKNVVSAKQNAERWQPDFN